MTHFCSLPISNSPLLAKYTNSNKAINSKEETNQKSPYPVKILQFYNMIMQCLQER